MNDNFEDNYKKMKSLLNQLEENKDNLDKSLDLYSQAKDIYDKLNNQIKDYKAKLKIIDSGKDE